MRDIEENYSKHKKQQGCRWTVIYGFAGVILLLQAANAVALLLGVWVFKARLVGICCACVMSCINFAAIIITGVFRFNSMGRLAALSRRATQFDSSISAEDYYLSDSWTYEKEAKLILWLWLCQVGFCFLCCAVSAQRH